MKNLKLNGYGYSKIVRSFQPTPNISHIKVDGNTPTSTAPDVPKATEPTNQVASTFDQPSSSQG